MIHVLHILPTLNICGGIENFVMNYYRHINRADVQFDFLVHKLDKENFKAEVEASGNRVYVFPEFTMKNLPCILRQLKHFYQNHNDYEIIHCHMANAALFHFCYVSSDVIKILHSHQPAGADKLSHKLRNYPLLKIANYMADVRLAGSLESGRFLFGDKDFLVVPNAIDKDLFLQARSYRSVMREQLNFKKKFVLGHIGRFAPVKNHQFLLDIIERLSLVVPEAVLCVIGDGETKTDFERQVQIRGLEDKVIILDTCRDVHKYYSAFDVFLLPSLYEGFGLVAIEAQYAGVPVLASAGRVPYEAKVSNFLHYVPLENGPADWVNKIIELRQQQACLQLSTDRYDIKMQAENLRQCYTELINKYANKGYTFNKRDYTMF